MFAAGFRTRLYSANALWSLWLTVQMTIPKSKLGGFLAVLYFILLAAALFEYAEPPPAPMDELALMVLTLPWSFLLGALISSVQANPIDHTPEFYGLILTSWVINMLIIYVIGAAIGRLFHNAPDNC